MSRDMSFPGINANDNRLPELMACLFNQPGVFYGGGTQDNALDAGFK